MYALRQRNPIILYVFLWENQFLIARRLQGRITQNATELFDSLAEFI
jgi:hypothetical protein